MKNSTLLLAGLLASTAAVAFAQTAVEPGKQGERQRHRQERVEAVFTEIDSNHDGRVSQSEWQAAQLRKSQEKFQQLDLDRNGNLSREEVESARDRHHGGRGGMRERLRGLDADGDEQLSRAEIGDKAPKLVQDFDRIDANRDGKLSQEELRAAHPTRGKDGAGAAGSEAKR
jgi:Ca2+-binding EF-hand superfamily protein